MNSRSARPDCRTWAIALVMLGAPAAAVAQAKAQELEYSWRTSELTKVAALKSGQVVRFTLTTINPLCYDYQIAITQVVATETLPDIIGLFSGTGVPKAAGPATATTTGTATPPSVPTAADIALQEIKDSVVSIEKGVEAAAKLVNEVGEAEKAAKEAVAALYAFACPAGGVRGPDVAPTMAVFDNAIKKLEALLAALPKVQAAEKLIVQAETSAGFTRGLIVRFGGFPEADQTRLKNDLQGLRARLGEAERALTVLRSGPFEAAKKIEKAQVSATIANLNRAVATPNIVRTLILRSTTDSVLIVVTAKGKAEIASVKGTVLSDPLSFPVFRKHRSFASAGFLASFLDEHHFVRANRSANVPAKPDSTVSTIIDEKDGKGFAFAPSVLLTTMFGLSPDLDLGFSAGVAVRSEGKPDFLLGLSLSIADRVVLTPAIHFGRVEKLLLGKPETVAAQSVPAAVTLESAVAHRWRAALALIISYRL